MSPNPKQWFKFDTSLFDEWIPKLPAEAGILLCVIVRKTYGEGKTEATLRVAQVTKMTGMKERSVQRNMASLLKSGAPVKMVGRDNHGTTYSFAEAVSNGTLPAPIPPSMEAAW